MILVVIPVRDVQNTIPSLLAAVQVASIDWKDRYRALVIDDGSSDNTASMVLDFASYGNFELVHHAEALGEGVAMMTGLRAAAEIAQDGDRIIILRADDIHAAALIKHQLLELAQGANIVLASRYSCGGRLEGQSPVRNVAHRASARIMRFLFPIPNVHDHDSCCIALDVRTLTRLTNRYGEQLITEKGPAWQLEFLQKINALGSLRFAEVPHVQRCSSDSEAPGVTQIIRRQARIISRGWRFKRVG